MCDFLLVCLTTEETVYVADDMVWEALNREAVCYGVISLL